jgi:hypothetical protein
VDSKKDQRLYLHRASSLKYVAGVAYSIVVSSGDKLYVGTATGSLFIYEYNELSGMLLLDTASVDVLISIPREWINFGGH